MPAVGGQHKVDSLVFFGGFFLIMFTSFFNLIGILFLLWLLVLCLCEISLHENVCLFIWVYFLYLCFAPAISVCFVQFCCCFHFFLLLLPICFLMRERNKGCAFGFVKRRRGGGGRSFGSRTVARIYCMKEIYFK